MKLHSRLEPAVRIYAILHNFLMTVREGKFDEGVVTEADAQGLNPIWFSLRKRGAHVTIELTGMTEEELDIFERGVTDAINTARKVVSDLDARATAALETEDYVPLRALRAGPINIFRDLSPTPRDFSAKTDIPIDRANW